MSKFYYYSEDKRITIESYKTLEEIKKENPDIPDLVDVTKKETTRPIPFYHKWNEQKQIWEEIKDLKTTYLIDQLNLKYDAIFDGLHKALVAAYGTENEADEKEIIAEIAKQNKAYEEELKKIMDGESAALTQPPAKRCPRCGAIMEDKGPYWKCTKCAYIEYKK